MSDPGVQHTKLPINQSVDCRPDSRLVTRLSTFTSAVSTLLYCRLYSTLQYTIKCTFDNDSDSICFSQSTSMHCFVEAPDRHVNCSRNML